MLRKLITAAAAVAAMAAAAGPVAHFPVTSYNFGAFDEEAGPVSYDFPLVNTGDAPLTILAARATCGCTTPVFPRKPVAPGDTAYISVEYNPMARPGRFNKQIYVETDASDTKKRLDVSGVVIGGAVTIARRYPADFGAVKLAKPVLMMGEVTKGRFKTVYFDGYNRSSDSLRIIAVRAPEYVSVAPAPEVAPPGEQLTLIAFVNGETCPLYGLVEDSVTMATDRGDTFTLPLTMIVQEDFSGLSPADMAKAPVITPEADRIDYGTLRAGGAPVTRSIRITNNGRSTLEIRRVYSADPGITAEAGATSLKPGKSAVVTATVDPSALPADILNARLTVISNDPLHPTTVIRLVGEKAAR